MPENGSMVFIASGFCHPRKSRGFETMWRHLLKLWGAKLQELPKPFAGFVWSASAGPTSILSWSWQEGSFGVLCETQFDCFCHPFPCHCPWWTANPLYGCYERHGQPVLCHLRCCLVGESAEAQKSYQLANWEGHVKVKVLHPFKVRPSATCIDRKQECTRCVAIWSWRSTLSLPSISSKCITSETLRGLACFLSGRLAAALSRMTLVNADTNGLPRSLTGRPNTNVAKFTASMKPEMVP